MKIVHVRWLDSGMHIDHGWDTRERYLQNISLDRMEVDTVGILMHEDTETVVVGLSHDFKHDTWYGAQLIAVKNIIDMRFLE